MLRRSLLRLLPLLPLGCGSTEGEAPRRVTKYGPLEVGKQLPTFSGVSEHGDEVGPTSPPGDFYVHVIDDRLPAVCLNAECGDGWVDVGARGGVLIGASDGKAAKNFGVELVSTSPYRFNTSLIVTTDAQARITAIYPGARFGDVPPKRLGARIHPSR